jgi:Tfp pilus assembly protein FimT
MRPGTTLVEVGIVLALAALVLAMGLPRWRDYLDRAAVAAASNSAAAALDAARHAAARGGILTAVRVDQTRNSLTVSSGSDTLLLLPLGRVHSVTLRASRDSITFAPNGFGYGAANTRLIIVRGAAAETLTVSRLGRIRR